jgi:uncharacterized RDD family membrane protein YckC
MTTDTNPSAALAARQPATQRTVVELAGVRRRLASLLYESLLVLGILALTFMIPYVLLGMFFAVAAPGWLLWMHVFVVLGAYFAWCWSHRGQTLAMQTWHLKLVRAADGRLAQPAACWLRYALAWPSLLLCGAGLWWALIDRDRQFLHDRLAGTRIVLLPKIPAR